MSGSMPLPDLIIDGELSRIPTDQFGGQRPGTEEVPGIVDALAGNGNVIPLQVDEDRAEREHAEYLRAVMGINALILATWQSNRAAERKGRGLRRLLNNDFENTDRYSGIVPDVATIKSEAAWNRYLDANHVMTQPSNYKKV